MDCLRSFAITTTDYSTYTVAGGNLKVWGASNNFHILDPSASNFNVIGFKNINIHGIDVVGNVSSAYTSTRINNANVSDWEVTVALKGQLPVLSGTVGTPNDFPIIANNQIIQEQYVLSKYKTSVKFATPIQSVTSIFLQDLKAFGKDAENALAVNMGFFFQFMVYYSFEGE